jgi:hypothetical protein
VADDKGTLELIATHLVLALQPLADAAADLESFRTFMLQLGWDIQSLPPEYVTLASDVVDAMSALERLGANPAPADVLGLIDKVRAIYTEIQALPAPAGADPAAFAAEIAERLFELLLADYLAAATPKVYRALRLLGIIDNEYVQAAGTRPAFLRVRLRYDQIKTIVNHPESLPATVYGWGTDQLDFALIAEQLLELFSATELPVYLGQASAVLGTGLQDSPGTAAGPVRAMLRIPLLIDNIAGVQTELGLALLELPAEPGAPAGLVLMPMMPSQVGLNFDIAPDTSLAVRAGTDIGAMFGVRVRPGAVSVRYPFQPGTPPPEAGIGATVKYHPGTPRTLLGRPDASRLEAADAWIGLVVESRGSLEIRAEAGTDGLSVVLSPADLDGFLTTVMGGKEVKLTFPIQVAWSNRTGLSLGASVGFQTSFNPHLQIGPLAVDQLDLAVRSAADPASPPDAELTVGVALNVALGPVAFSCEGIGLRLDAVLRDGNAGPFDLSVGFNPPSGLGIVVDAGPVTGGGFISFDPPSGRYAGGLELKIEEIVVKAFGLLDTKLPDGKPGFSFLIIITTEFPPIQLGFGFTLMGVGGLAGVNRTMMLDALEAGFRAHSINSVLFPDIHNVQKIISDLRAIFPPADGRYVFGPMVEIGWGTPTLVAAQIGIVLEIPAPIRLAILGLVVATLPEDDGEDTIVLIHLDVLGTVDFGLKKLAIDASIYDSRIVAFSLFGDMALRLSWGADATFAFAMGGFHPQYQPPPDFPHLRRLTLSIGDGDNPRMALQTYIAVTSNTVQFGADLELYAAYGGFQVHGYLAFDALFVISPFSFTTEMRAGVDVQYNGASLAGISLDFVLIGPTPWTYHGSATLHFLFFDVSVGVQGSFGGGTAAPLPAEPVIDPLLKALNDPRNWTAALPEGATRGVSFSAAKPDDKTIYVHPLGQLTVRQTVVPLATPITKFGSARPSDGDEFDIKNATLTLAGGQATPVTTSEVTDSFARAQYEDMTDGEKLAAKSYEPFPSGVMLGDPTVEAGTVSTLDVHYDTQIIDDLFLPARSGPRYRMTLELQNALARQGAGAQSPVRSTGDAKYKWPAMTSPIATLTPGFVVTSVDDLSVRYDITGGEAATQRAATVKLTDHIAQHPEDAGRLQVMPLHEVPV